MCEQLRVRCKEMIFSTERKGRFQVTLSIGAATLSAAAEVAMRIARRSKDCVVTFVD
jgi:hypothetical protein